MRVRELIEVKVRRISSGFSVWLILSLLSSVGGAASADSVRFLPEAGDAWSQRVKLMTEAKRSIEVVMFIWKDDQVGLEMAGLLRDAALRGVQVRVVCDALARSVPSRIMKVLELHPNLHIHNYHPVKVSRPLWLNRRLHDKMMIVDQTHLIIGGRNFADRYFDAGEDWNYIDLDVFVSGGVAKKACAYFESLWSSTHVRDLISPPLIRHSDEGRIQSETGMQNVGLFREGEIALSFDVGSSKCAKTHNPRDSIPVLSNQMEFVHEIVPRKIDGAVCLRRLRELIGEAKNEVWITTPWLVMTKGTREVFRECLAKGVKIHILTNSLHANKDFLVFAAHLKSCNELANQGALIHCLPGPDSIHSKGIVIDQKLAVVGTLNMDPRSEFWNTESMVVMRNADAASNLRSVILRQAEGSEIHTAKRSCITSAKAPGFATRMKRMLLPVLKLVSLFVRPCL